jgi:crotonobetainyl-CoA:carnitine CoA-transferase CaiB-like acyl-CoA transferase
VRWPGPPLGAHNAEVFGALGISETELAHLKREGIV